MRSPSRYADLIDVATELFSEHGYEGTTVRMMADRLGIQSGSLYSHIRSKDEMLREIATQVADDFLARATAARAETQEPEATLRALCRAHLEVLHERQAAVTVYYDQWRKLDERSRAEISSLRSRYEKHFADTIKQGVETGAFEPVDTRTAVYLVLSACNWTYQWYSPEGALGPEEIADMYVDVLMRGLRRRDVAAGDVNVRDALDAPSRPATRRRRGA